MSDDTHTHTQSNSTSRSRFSVRSNTPRRVILIIETSNRARAAYHSIAAMIETYSRTPEACSIDIPRSACSRAHVYSTVHKFANERDVE